MTGYPAALALTLAVELPVYFAALRVMRAARAPVVFALAIGVNLVTHPLVWWTLGVAAGFREGYEIVLLPVEIAAWLAEAALLGAVLGGPRRQLLHAALAANAASFVAGLVAVGLR